MSIDALVVARRNGGVSWTVAGAAFGIVISLWSDMTIAVDLLDPDLSVDPRRIVEVLARLGERGGHGVLSCDELPQALVWRRKRPLDHDVGGVGQTAALTNPACALHLKRPWPRPPLNHVSSSSVPARSAGGPRFSSSGAARA